MLLAINRLAWVLWFCEIPFEVFKSVTHIVRTCTNLDSSCRDVLAMEVLRALGAASFTVGGRSARSIRIKSMILWMDRSSPK